MQENGFRLELASVPFAKIYRRWCSAGVLPVIEEDSDG